MKKITNLKKIKPFKISGYGLTQIKNLIKRNTAKKPTTKYIDKNDILTFECPRCMRTCSCRLVSLGLKIKPQDVYVHCPYCGQRLDWE